MSFYMYKPEGGNNKCLTYKAYEQCIMLTLGNLWTLITLRLMKPIHHDVAVHVY